MAQPTVSNQAVLTSGATPAASAPTPALAPINGGTFGSGPDALVLTLAENAYQGDAKATIAIDGKTLTAQPITVTAEKNAGQYETFTFKGTFGAGAHDLAVSFLNDAYGGTPATDRNLFVNGASYDGISTRPSAAELNTTGTTHFTIPPASDPEATPMTINGGTFGSGPDTLVVTLAEDAFKGNAQANIAIDGHTLTAQPVTVTALQNAGQNETFTFKGTFGAAAHDLAVSFLNDAYGGTPTTDRNLYVNAATYNGASARPSTAELDSTGTARFTIPPAGTPDAVVGPVATMPNTLG